MSYTTTRFAIRTVRDGAVKICGVRYHVDTQQGKYCGELNGKRYAFGRYWQVDKYLPLVFLWGSEREFLRVTAGFLTWADFEPDYVIGGQLPYVWWRARGVEII